jgi:ribosomal protein S18 acetylase RimI-like enzyme
MTPTRENSSIALRPITGQCAGAFKEVRLRALKDTPTAFGSTYAREVQLTDAEWEKRAGQWNAPGAAAYLAWEGEKAVGIVAGFLEKEDARRACLVSMWVAPEVRRRGVGRRLVEKIVKWAEEQGARALRLSVTSNNERAILFYEGLGFVKTGKTEPYSNDPALVEFEMGRRLAADGHR